MKEFGKLKDACIVIAGQSPKGSSYNDEGNGMEFHQGKKAFGLSIIEHSNVWTTELTKIAEAGDILMSVRAPVGPTNLTNRKICIGRGLAAIRCKDGILPQYILYSLRNIETNIVGNDGAVFNSINKQQIENLPLPLLPLSEQQEIVDYLDTAFAKIDAMKANAAKALEEGKALFQSALKQMLEPKEGWEEKKLKQIGKTQTGTTPSKSDAGNYGDFIPFIRPSEINYDGTGTIEYNSAMMLSEQGANIGRVFEPCSIFMVCIGATIGKVGFSERTVSCNQQINILTPYDFVDYKFAYYFMSTSNFQSKVIKEGTSSQATLPIINKGKWEQLTISYPTLSEQKDIVSILDSILSKVDRLQENYDKIVKECDTLKQAILRQVFE